MMRRMVETERRTWLRIAAALAAAGSGLAIFGVANCLSGSLGLIGSVALVGMLVASGGLRERLLEVTLALLVALAAVGHLRSLATCLAQ